MTSFSAWAILPPQDEVATKRAERFVSSERLEVGPSIDLPDGSARAAVLAPQLMSFFNRHGQDWKVFWDERSQRPHRLEGAGIPIFPGRGNTLKSQGLKSNGEEGTNPQLAEVEELLHAFIVDHADLLQIGPDELRLDPLRSTFAGRDGHYASIELQQFHDGLPVVGANVFFRINNGNIVQFGADRIGLVTVSTKPTLGRDEALALALGHAAVEPEEVAEILVDGELQIHPALAEGETRGERYRGVPGFGYQHLLAYTFKFRFLNDVATYEAMVDAHSGEILRFQDTNAYAQVRGGVYPNSNDTPTEDRPFPFASLSNGEITDADGNFSGASASVTLNGRYIRISDSCGSISRSNGGSGDIDLGTSGGTDCATPGFGGSGNTHSARSGFWHLTTANRDADRFLPSNSWIDGTLTANMNLNNNCNAFWNGSTVNFYTSGGGCNNTGEIAGVFVHEWGHGFDQNAGGSSSDSGTSEGFADVTAFLYTRDECIGTNFFQSGVCTGCTTCTGVRSMADFSLGGARTIASPSTIADNNGINCDALGSQGCPFIGTNGSTCRGTMQYECHCEGYIGATAHWDLTQSLVAALGSEDAGYEASKELWYGAATAVKRQFRIASGGTCNPSASIDGCDSTNWYTVLLGVDDDDGNLANGTPNGCRIWDAYNAHGIACGARPECSGLAPQVTISQPAAGSTFTEGDAISFAGTADDFEDGDLTAGLSWTSNLDGAIGSGGSFVSSALSAGSHTITASATDSDGQTGSSAVGIVVDPAGCSVIERFESGAGGWTNSPSSTCTTGSFVIGTPTEVIDSGVTTQLGGDHSTGTGNAFYSAVNTAAGTDDVDGGTCIVESPTYTVSEASSVSIWYFHGQRDAGDDSGDFFDLEVSTDGGSTWTSIASHGDVTLNASWTEATTSVAAGSNVRFRVRVADGTANGDLVEAGVDDLLICSTGGGGNTAPQVTISQPTDGASFTEGDAVTFTGSATDAEDGALSSGLSWTSSLDGSIGSGASFSTSTLSVGSHTITASVTDSGGLQGSDAISITVELDPGTGCTDCIDWNSTATVSYSNQDASANVTVEDGGDTLLLQDNTWRRTTQTFAVTPNTVLEFEYRSTAQGEIHGIGFDEDDTLTNNTRIFQIWGTQTWGNAYQNAQAYSGSGSYETFQIAVGQFYTGSALFLVLANDNDAGSGNNGRFRNVRVFENVPSGNCTVQENFESGAGGWTNSPSSTCSTGSFIVGSPTAVSNGGVTTQPSGDHTTGVGNAFFSAANSSAGVDDVDGGTCIVTSPVYAVSAASNVSVWYFHGQRDAGDDGGDFFTLEISTDGGSTWSTMASVGDVTLNASWTLVTTSVAAGDDVQFRVQVADGTANGDLIEAGIDDVSICE